MNPSEPFTLNGESGMDSGPTYASSVSPRELDALAAEEIKKPELPTQAIEAISQSQGPDGKGEAETLLAKIFEHTNGQLRGTAERLLEVADAGRKGLEQRLNQVAEIHHATEPYNQLHAQGIPWTRISWIQVWFLAVASCALLGIGWNTVAQVLFGSGIPGFEQLWRCYLFSLTPVGVALALKMLPSYIEHPQRKRAYAIAIWIVGLLLSVAWILLFAATFPGMTQSTAEIVESLASGTQNRTHTGVSFIVVSMLAESFIAAGCWLAIQSIADKHQPSIRVPNPAYQQTQRDIDHWTQRLYEHDNLCGKINGKLDALDNAKQVFVRKGISYFYRVQSGTSQQLHLSSLFKRKRSNL